MQYESGGQSAYCCLLTGRKVCTHQDPAGIILVSDNRQESGAAVILILQPLSFQGTSMAYKYKEISNPKSRQSIRFLQTAADTKGELLEMETLYGAHSTEPMAHYHPHQDEDFEVLAGELTIRINGALQVLKKGETIHIPANTVHAMWNQAEDDTLVNWKVRPAMDTEHLLETNFGLAYDGKTRENGMPSLLQLAVTASKYAHVFRVAKPPFVIQKILFSILTPFAWLAGKRADYRKYIN